MSFISEDYRNTAASNILKWVVSFNVCNKKTQKTKEKASKEDVGQKKGISEISVK